MDKLIRRITVAICINVGFLCGKVDGLIYALLIFIILDCVTGVIATCINKNPSSETGFKGIEKKIVILFVVAVGNMVDICILGGGAVCCSTVVGVYLADEGIRIFENARNLGIPLPKKDCFSFGTIKKG